MGIHELRGELARRFGNSGDVHDGSMTSGPLHALRACAVFGIAVALFATARPARADNAVAVNGPGLAATIANAEAQAAALADAVVPSAAGATVGSASAIPAGVSEPVVTRPPAGRDEEAAVVAPSGPVVSPSPPSTPTPSGHSDGQAAPAAAMHALARQYQENPGRYQAVNSIPISHVTVPESALRSVEKRSPFRKRSSPRKSPAIALPKCLQNLPESALQPDCEDILAQLTATDVSALVQTATTGDSTQHRPRPPHRRETRTRPARRAAPPSSAVGSASPAPAPARPRAATRAIHPETVAVRLKPHPVVRPRVAPFRRSPRPTTPAPQRESARADRPQQSLWLQFGLVLLLVGSGSIALALGSTRPQASALVGLVTRLRSKSLSGAARPARREGIRYRE
jgi:hypothetical protein